MAADHQECLSQSKNAIPEIVIGMADGLAAPFALAAGLFSAVDFCTSSPSRD
jgi:hypothetical protein